MTPRRLLILFSLAAACGSEGNETCSTVRGLTDGVCKGSPTSCSSFSALTCPSDGCTVDIGAYDNPYDNRCTGYAKSCDHFTSDWACRDQSGCQWVADTEESGAAESESIEACEVAGNPPVPAPEAPSGPAPEASTSGPGEPDAPPSSPPGPPPGG